MSNILELRKQTFALMSKNAQLAEKMNYSTSASNIKNMISSFDSKKMTIVVAGEARRGKSSLLNALVRETQQVFPVDINVCTNIVTSLEYGEKEEIFATFHELNEEGEIIFVEKSITRADIVELVTEDKNAGNFKNVSNVRAKLPIPLLKDGIVFVDTPGVGSLNTAHAETTYAYLPQADVVLFVSDTGAGLTATELNFLKKAYEYCQTIIYPLTKKDLNPQFKTIVDDNLTKIKEALNIPESEVEIIPVSSELMQRYLKTKDEAKYTRSNYKQLDEAIFSIITKHKIDVLVTPFIQATKEELLKISDTISTQYHLIQDKEKKTPQLIAALEDEKKKIMETSKDKNTWSRKIQIAFNSFSSSKETFFVSLNSEAQNIMTKDITILNSEICKEENYKALVEKINKIYFDGIINLQNELKDTAFKLVENMSEELNLNFDFNSSALENINFEQNSELSVDFPVRSMKEKLINGGRKVGMTSYAASGITAIPTLILGASALPIVLVGALATCYGTYVAIKENREVDIPIVRNAMTSYIAQQNAKIRSEFRQMITDAQYDLTEIFSTQLDSNIVEIQENIERLRKNLNMSKEESVKKIALLKAQNNAVRSSLNELEKFEQQVMKISQAQKQQIEKKNTETVQPKTQSEPTSEVNADSQKVTYDFL